MVTYFFTSDSININAPTSNGVYFLYENGELIYIGKSAAYTTSIRSRLLDHFNGNEGPCTQSATNFSYELCTDPDKREVELIQQAQAQMGRLPRCNDRVG